MYGTVRKKNSKEVCSMAYRCGKEPSRGRQEFVFTTMEVEKYLNAKFKMIAKAIRDSGNKDEEDVIIKVCGRKYGYNFYPIVAVMTPNVLQPSKYADSSIPDYFRGEDPDNVWLKS